MLRVPDGGGRGVETRRGEPLKSRGMPHSSLYRSKQLSVALAPGRRYINASQMLVEEDGSVVVREVPRKPATEPCCIVKGEE